jgi:hypothetical protein
MQAEGSGAMDNDAQLKDWTADWQGGSEQGSSGEAIRLYTQGRSRFMWKWLLSELAVGAIALPVLAYLGWMATDRVERWAMGLLAVITVAAMSVGWWNWRGSLLASAKTTADFVAVSTERLRRMRQAWRIGWVVLAAQVAVFAVWIPSFLGNRAHTVSAEWFAWGWLGFMTLSAVTFLLWLDRRMRRDEEKFTALTRELLM